MSLEQQKTCRKTYNEKHAHATAVERPKEPIFEKLNSHGCAEYNISICHKHNLLPR
jgi:hypothetical protein